MAKLQAVNVEEKFSQIRDYWRPRIAGEVNDFQVKLAKLAGEFVWHRHQEEDELFLVVKGQLQIRLRDGDIWVREGEFAIVPRGVEHKPVAHEEVHVLLFERRTTLNTGDVRNERTVESPERV